MKKLLFILLVWAGTASAQVQGQKLDSLLRPAKTDSADFSNPAYIEDTASMPSHKQPARKDSLPADDRKPPKPPKK